MSSLAELIGELVRIDSVNPGLVPGAAGEGEIARFVAEWAERAGLEVEVEEAAPGRPNVIATARGSGGGRSLMLNAHTDTVGVAGHGGAVLGPGRRRPGLRTRRVRHEGEPGGVAARRRARARRSRFAAT